MSLLLALLSSTTNTQVDPGVGAIAFTGHAPTVTQSQVPVETGAHSGVTRLWLIDYYTREFAKNKKADAVVLEAPAKPKKVTKVVARKVEKAVAKAEKQLETLTQTLKTEQDSQQFTMALLRQISIGVVVPNAEIDFYAIAEQYREKLRRDDDELLLLALAL